MCIHRLKRIKDKINSWLEHHGNKALPEVYFFPLTTLTIAWLPFIIYGAYVYSFTYVILEYIFQQQIVGIILPLPHVLFFFGFITLFMVGIFFILLLGLSYLRKRTRYTFRNERKIRKIILQRDRWSVFFEIVTKVIVLLLYFSLILVLILFIPNPAQHLLLGARSLVASVLQDFIPVHCTLLCIFLISFLLVDSGIPQSEKLLFVADSLINLREPQKSNERKKWKKDMEYYIDAFVTTLGKLILSQNRTIREVKLTCLKPILLALFSGDSNEQSKAKDILSELPEYFDKDEMRWHINLVNWLGRVEANTDENFSRFTKLEETISMKLTVRKGILPTRPATIVAMIASLMTITGLTIWKIIDIILTFIGEI